MLRLSLLVIGLTPCLALAQEWRPVTVDLIEKEKPGYGKLCGVAVDHGNGHVYVDLSEKGIYRSTDQGKSWQALGRIKGRTEWPGCLMLDPTKGAKRMVAALVYGAPISISEDGGETFRPLAGKSTHVDWCAVDWSDPALGFILALKHESGGLLLVSRDGGKTFDEVGKGHGPAWVFDGKTAVIVQAKSKSNPEPAILRTEDGAKTFAPVAKHAATALPRMGREALYWLVEGGIIATSDQGKTWQKVGDLKDGRVGPIFGKSDDHFFVLTGKGIVETTDRGKSWREPIKLPKELRGVGPLTWLEYDPVHDVLYAMKMTSELYKLERKTPRTK